MGKIYLSPTSEQEVDASNDSGAGRKYWKAQQKINERLETAEFKLTPSQIVLTVTSSDEYKNDKAQLQSQISVNATQISLRATKSELNDLGARVTTNEAQLVVQSNLISSKVSSTDYNGNTIASLINQTATTIQISAAKINLSGYVTVTNLSTSGQTIINGDNITTGTLNADRINANSLNVNKLQTGTTLGGAGLIAFNSGNITLFGSSINDASLNFNNNGSIVRIYNYGTNVIGISSNLYVGGGVTIDGNLNSVNQISSYTILPRANNTYSLGTSSFRWASIWQTSGAVTGSDRVLKKDIEDIVEATSLVKLLRPRRYIMKDGDSGRPHYGYIAQEVKEALDTLGIDSGMYIDPTVKEIPENGSGYAKGLRYEEFSALTMAVVKNLLERVEVLENEIKDLRTL